MKRINVFFAAAALAGMTMLLGAGAAEACTVTGKVRRVDVSPGTSNSTILVAPSTSNGIVPNIYYCTTTDAKLIAAVQTALSGNDTVTMICNYSAWNAPFNNYIFGGSVTTLQLQQGM